MLNFQRHLVNCRFLFLQGSSVSSIVCFLHLQYCDSDAEKRAILRSQFQKLGGDLKFYSASSLNVFLSDHAAIVFLGNCNLKGGTILRSLLSNGVFVGILPVTKGTIDFICNKQEGFHPLLFLYCSSFLPVPYIAKLPQRFFLTHRTRKPFKELFLEVVCFALIALRKKHSVYLSLLLFNKIKNVS